MTNSREKQLEVIKKTLLVFGGFLLLLLLIAALRSPTYQVSRTAKIAATPQRIFPLIDDYRSWNNWSPWAKLDPAMRITYSGPFTGVGATYTWAGNDSVGEGKMTTLESRPPEYMKIKLDYRRPFESHSITEFTVKPSGSGSEVTWTMTGEADFLTRVFTLIASMDRMVGPDFDKGLAQLKARAEAPQ